jgi:2-oxoglutarate ferredoxin oxidoreductase subunit alpha
MQDYRSRIRGGHNFFQVRFGNRPFYSQSDPVHLLLALTPESVALHADNVAEGGAIVVPDGFHIDQSLARRRHVSIISLPLLKIAAEHGNRLMVNTAELGAAAGLTGFPFEAMESVIRHNFARKGQEVMEGNLRVAQAAFTLARDTCGKDFPYRLRLPEQPRPRLLMNGNQAFALGALAGGCRFIAAYPMTPATSIMEWLASVPPEYGVVIKHTEDEIAAVCMAIGASFAGARAMTATSGGGFSLMAEALGLAGMTEVPLVIVDAQRGGPSTGLPTRTEQSDLLFTVHASQGEFPRIVTAPSTVEECFETGWRSFNLADRYQCPVIVLTDTFLASSLRTVDPEAIDFAGVQIDRGATLDHEDLDQLQGGYQRFQFTGTGISPRAIPGHPRAIYPVSSDEHDESGHITEDNENRVRMMKKRMHKLEEARDEMRPPEVYGPADAEVTLVTWGSTYGACREAADQINAAGGSAGVLKFTDLWPLPAGAAERALRRCRRTVAVEQNYTSQLAQLIRTATGLSVDRTLAKYDGRPFAPEEIVGGISEEAALALKA